MHNQLEWFLEYKLIQNDCMKAPAVCVSSHQNYVYIFFLCKNHVTSFLYIIFVSQGPKNNNFFFEFKKKKLISRIHSNVWCHCHAITIMHWTVVILYIFVWILIRPRLITVIDVFICFNMLWKKIWNKKKMIMSF